MSGDGIVRNHRAYLDGCQSIRSSVMFYREIHQAAQTLGRPNQLFADAVDARQEIDLRIGASFTRFQTMLLRDCFVLPYLEEEKKLVLSYGPCQFPTLGFIVERYWQVQAHEPEEFWTISCFYSAESGDASFSWLRGRLFDYLSAAVIYEMCIEEPTATVCQVTGQESRKYPPHPLNTVELQKRASRYFRMSSEQTMKVAEELYQAGYMSYPRTETDFFSENTDLKGITGQQVRHPQWGPYAERLLNPEENLWRNPSNGGHDDKAHPPIHPTRFSEGEPGWTNDHKNIYELVVRHFLACVSQPAIGYGTHATIDIAGEQFSAHGLMIIAKNYLEVYRFDSWGASTIPKFEVGQQFIPTRLTLDSGTTMPPPLLSEADLISLMDQAGIGTDATMHDHIKKCLDRRYATKDAHTRFCPTNLGEALVMGYDDMGYELWKPYLRAMMEKDMKAVSEGSKSKAQILHTSLQQMRHCFLDAKMQKEKLLESMGLFFERTQSGEHRQVGENVSPCNACGVSNLALKRKPDGKYMVGCLNFPQCRNVVWLPGAILEAAVTTEVCSSCRPGPVFKIRFKFRRAEIPLQYSSDYTGCVGGCDDILKDIINVCGSGGGARGPRGSGNGNLNRVRTCPTCGNSGHQPCECTLRRTQLPQPPDHQPNNLARSPGGEEILCLCQEACTLLTANTEANRGRKFYRCHSRLCDFFKWEEDQQPMQRVPEAEQRHGQNRMGRKKSTHRADVANTANLQGSRTHRGIAGDGRFVSATGETSQSGRCFRCGDPTHWANACPSRGL
ncbi:hypothetical protein O6H91_20G022100 [Diphasiastrum complanatum]|uniref:Uncharacterized protein n=6 Tax=Diphasiastrum complanatum TaxID=34168 RepID=A0ACC2AQ45_DIPCM|nr:hypothetical protein O6H91_20G022100 [Diphasiastrum complanatum]